MPRPLDGPDDAGIRLTRQVEFFGFAEVGRAHLDQVGRNLGYLADWFALDLWTYEGVLLAFIVYPDDKYSVVTTAESLSCRGQWRTRHLSDGTRAEYD